MPTTKGMKYTIVSKFKSFCKHSSLHGVYYFYKGTNWCVHIVWCLIIVSSLSLCCFLGHMIWEKFVRDPTLTVVESTHYSVSNIPFPAVSICDTEKVYGPKTQEITDLLLLRGYNMSEIRNFYRSFTDMNKKGYTAQPTIKKIHSVLDDIGYNFKALLDVFKRPCNDMLAECNWRSRMHNCSQMFRPVFTIVGHCCQFDIPYFMQQADEQVHFDSGIESTEALDVVVNSEIETVDGNETGNYPVLYVFDNKDKVTLVDSFIAMTPDALFDVNVDVWTIDSSDYVKALSLNNRKCILETDQGAGAGFYEGCMTRLILQRVVARCRCLPFDYTATDMEDFPYCTWERLLCIYQAIELVQADIKGILSESECYQRCDYVQYNTEMEYVMNHRSVSQSQARVSIHFEQSTCLKYRREVLYTWDQMLANLGGIFGLCLGGSIISITEIVWFLLDLLSAIATIFCKRELQKKKVEDKSKVLTVSQKKLHRSKHGKVGPYKFVH